MPYKTKRGTWQSARKLGHVPIVENQSIKERLREYRVFRADHLHDLAGDLLVSVEDLREPGAKPKWILSFDGSSQEVAVQEQYPSTRVGYIQIAGVLVYLDKIRDQAETVLVDPAAVRAAARESLLSIVLPCSNVCRRDAATVRDSWRAEMFEIFRDYQVEGQPLLDILFSLLRLGGRTSASGDEGVLRRCSAHVECEARELEVPRQGGVCNQCGGAVFPTDCLRIHEEVQELNPNLTALGRLRGLLEHLVMLCYVAYLLERQPSALSSVAFVVDGPLALFGPQAPLKRALLEYLRFVARELARKTLEPPIVVGIEKSGQFAEHAAQIADRIPERTLMRLPDSYIFERVLASRGFASGGFGEDTYYGRKFFYKTATGQMLTLTVPCLDQTLLEESDADDPACYSRLPDMLALLDEIGTKLYEDAVIPIALAHSYASIPLRTGSQVLTLLSRELLARGD